MKRTLLAVAVVLLVAGALGAQTIDVDLSALGDDFTVLMAGLGYDLLPNFQQAAIWSVGPGVASLGESRFYVSMSLGALLSDGILSVINDGDYELLDVGGLLESALSAGGSTSAGDAITFIQGFFPYPVLRAAVGFAAGPVEVGVDVSGFPQGITDGVTGLAGRLTGATIDGVTLSAFHIGARARTPLVTAGGPLPEVSVGAGYSLSTFQLGYGLDSIGSLDDLGGVGSLTLEGTLTVATDIHSFGIDVNVSKRLGFFAPFIGLSPYLQLAEYTGGVEEFDAVLSDGTISISYTDDDPATNQDPVAVITDTDLGALLTGGFELFLGRTVIFVHGSYTVGEGSPGVSLGTRLQL